MKINMHTSHPSAFISSTFVDLRQERNAVAETLRLRGLNVNALDVKPASTTSSKNEILVGIRESDFVILIIGDRYGSVNNTLTGSESMSITWWEYNKAYLYGKPVLAYFKNKTGFQLEDNDDPDEKTYKHKRIQFERFKQLVSTRHNPAFFSNTNELTHAVDMALISTYRSGVRSLTQQKEALQSKITGLESELNRLKNQIPQPSLNELAGIQSFWEKQSDHSGGTILDLPTNTETSGLAGLASILRDKS